MVFGFVLDAVVVILSFVNLVYILLLYSMWSILFYYYGHKISVIFIRIYHAGAKQNNVGCKKKNCYSKNIL